MFGKGALSQTHWTWSLAQHRELQKSGATSN